MRLFSMWLVSLDCHSTKSYFLVVEFVFGSVWGTFFFLDCNPLMFVCLFVCAFVCLFLEWLMCKGNCVDFWPKFKTVWYKFPKLQWWQHGIDISVNETVIMMNLIVTQIWRALPQSCITNAWSKLHLIFARKHILMHFTDTPQPDMWRVIIAIS